MSEPQKKLPFVLGITGTIGSGKSLVGKLLVEHKVPVLDSDIVVHEIFKEDQDVVEKIKQAFGPEVIKLADDNRPTVDRQALGGVVFRDKEARVKLEQIVHPAVNQYCTNWIQSSHEKIVALLIPLLFETARPRRYDQVWTVKCEDSTLRERLKIRNKFTDEEIDSRLKAQLPQSEKIARADAVIDNSGSIEETKAQLNELLENLSSTL